MSMRDAFANDIKGVFLNLDEFAERRTIIYDDETYTDVPVVLTGLKEQERSGSTSNRAEGLYRVTSVLHCDITDIGGIQPEQGKAIKISDVDDPLYFKRFFIATSTCELGMIRLELEVVDE